MNWEHFKTFVWLRWRLRSNQRKRASAVSVVIQTIGNVLAIGGAVVALGIGVVVGVFVMREAAPGIVLLVWDGVVAIFLLIWTAELLAELQRSEILSLDRFLHLPVSLTSVFLLNYLGSIVCASGIAFLPAMVGLSIGLVFSKGWHMLLLLPLLAAMALAVTAITYQFRGWLASLMLNQRRRRTIIVLASLVFMLVTQLPNIWNMSRSRSNKGNRGSRTSLVDAQRYAKAVSLAVPFGWLPYGAMALAEENSTPALLGTLGLALIGAASLRRSYRTTLRIYTGDFTSKKPRRVIPAVKETKPSAGSTALMEKQLPWASEQASAIALAGFRSLMRAPEAKMMLVSPVILVVVFGRLFTSFNSSPPEILRPLMAAGAITMLFFMTMGLAGNQFGFDRSGFRVFVLSPAARKDILLGKTLSLSPYLLTLAIAVVGVMQLIRPMRADHFIAVLVQLIPMYLVFSLVANFLSILAPCR